MKKTQVVFITMATMIVLYFVTVIPMLGVRMIKIKESYSVGEWMYYSTAQALVNEADFVYEGKVVGIDFDTLSTVTAKHMNYSSNPKEVEFYTIYKIEVTKVYKGDVDSKVVLKVMGGIENDHELEQKIVLAKSDMPYWTIIKDKPEIKVGESYLFCTEKSASGDKQQNFTIEQIAFSEKDEKVSQQVNYDSIIKYVTSEDFINPPKVPTTYVDNEISLMKTSEEIVNSSERIFEGYIWKIQYFIRDSKMYTWYRVLVDDTYKGTERKTAIISVEGGIDDYMMDEQYRLLNSAGINERKVFKDMQKLEVGKKYLFAVGYSGVNNPAQFAFCSDNSNAPGGVDYKMMKEYLKK